MDADCSSIRFIRVYLCSSVVNGLSFLRHVSLDPLEPGGGFAGLEHFAPGFVSQAVRHRVLEAGSFRRAGF